MSFDMLRGMKNRRTKMTQKRKIKELEKKIETLDYG
jgi:hypothetical protein